MAKADEAVEKGEKDENEPNKIDGLIEFIARQQLK